MTVSGTVTNSDVLRLTCIVEKYGKRVTAMAVVHAMMDNSEISHPSIKAFLHQRTRQWKYSDLCSNATQCTELPDDYVGDTSARKPSQDNKPVRWNEHIAEPRPLSKIMKTLPNLTLNVVPPTTSNGSATESIVSDNSSEWKTGSVPCPTFAGGKEPTGECIFTDPLVQRAILDFFEEVAQYPENYRNPAFNTFADIPQPTVDAPLALSTDTTIQETSHIQTAHHMLTPEQQKLEEARSNLADMRIALSSCPDDVDALAKGRARLGEKITKQEVAVKNLEVKALNTVSLGAGETEDERKDWKPKVEGTKIPFAGTMADSELLKAAGLFDTASEELGKLEDEEKAFI
jgi:hypothetical protein